MRYVLASGGPYDLEGWVADDADLGEVFTLIAPDGTSLQVNGWLFTTKTIEPPKEN